MYIISVNAIRCLLLFPTVSRRFVISAHVGDDPLDFGGFLNALANLVALVYHAKAHSIDVV